MKKTPPPDTPFARRREKLYDALGEGVALLFATPEAQFGHDQSYRYRPDPDLYYLTGFREPETVALLDADRRRLVLFVRPKDRTRETWEGRRAGPVGARAEFGADEAHPVGELAERLPELIRGKRTLHHALGVSAENDRLVGELLARFRREARDPRRGPVRILDVTEPLHAMRLVKEEDEVALMQRAADVAAAAHRDAMALSAPGRFEYELEAAIDARFRRDGAGGPSYGTIVATGVNATILHYTENRDRLAEGDLVLVDAGCEVEGYASDITRTFPATGKFTRIQEKVYRIVLEAEKAAIAAVAPGVRFMDVQEAAHDVLVEGLVALGVLKGKVATLKRKKAQERFTLHRISHWLGLDVHDRGRYMDEGGEPRKLEPGMVLTVEPGLYFRPDEKGVPANLLGIGIRIEDDVLVTPEGNRVLTAAAPKEVAELRAVMAR